MQENPNSAHQSCPACQHDTSHRCGRITGYVRGSSFYVSECDRCHTQTVRPTTIPKLLYDAIYANADRIEGGYDRYVSYAREVARQNRPFDWLAAQEDMYWGVREVFGTLALEAGAKIVEVGSGLGYLTHALRAAGFDAHGVDLSHIAVDAARKRYGEHYSVGDAADSVHLSGASAVIAMELLEHLADPAVFLTRLREAMHAASTLILSTPNRDTYPSSTVWNTDLPPVHLHWFSEEGITALARRCGFTVSFVDFTSRNNAARHTRWIAGQRYRSPRFDETLQPCVVDASTDKAGLTWMRVVQGVRSRVESKLRVVFGGEHDVLHGRRSVALVALLNPTE